MRRGLLALLLVSALASGCGSSGEKRLSKAEFAQRADAVCRRTNRLTQPATTPTSMPGLARLAEQSLPPLDRALRELRAQPGELPEPRPYGRLLVFGRP